MLNFTKMQGAGNNFIVFEDYAEDYKDLESLAKKLCDRNFGIGGDGILVARKTDIADVEMIIINADGSYAGMCGNGIRCFAKYVYENNLVNKTTFNVKTGDGIKSCDLIKEEGKIKGVRINMGIPSFETKVIPAEGEGEILQKEILVEGKKFSISSLLLGVPHTVIITEEDNFNVKDGALIERYELFPEGTNVNFCRVISKNEIKVDTWERGAGATLACGTGCCSSVVVCARLNITGKEVTVRAPGGILKVEIKEEGIIMTGPAENVFQGQINI